MIDRKDYIARIKAKLDEWDDELEKLEERAKEVSGDAVELGSDTEWSSKKC